MGKYLYPVEVEVGGAKSVLFYQSMASTIPKRSRPWRNFFTRISTLVLPNRKKCRAWADCPCLSFEGDAGTGKHEMSLWLAKRLFVRMFNQMNPGDLAVIVCGSPGEHPGRTTWWKPDGQTIKVDQIRQLQEEFSKSGFWKVAWKSLFFNQKNEYKQIVLLEIWEEPVGNFYDFRTESCDWISADDPKVPLSNRTHFSPLAKRKLQTKLQKKDFSRE